MTPASERWHKRSNTHSIRTPVENEEKVRTGEWLQLVLCFFECSDTSY